MLDLGTHLQNVTRGLAGAFSDPAGDQTGAFDDENLSSHVGDKSSQMGPRGHQESTVDEVSASRHTIQDLGAQDGPCAI